MVSDGQVEVWLQCAEPSQYLGANQADLYLRATDASFALNFVKGYLGIWLQTVLVIALGVMFSTFLSGPVAMLATLGTLVGGFFNDFMYRLATGQTYGGGPFESIIRIWTQQNVTSEAEPGLRTTVAQTLDQVAEAGLRVLAGDPARLRTVQLLRQRRQRLQHPRRHAPDVHLPGAGVRAAGVRGGVSVSEEPGGGAAVGIRD